MFLTVRENVSLLVVEFTPQALGGHPVGAADLRESVVGAGGDLGREAKVRHDRHQIPLAGTAPLDQYVLREIEKLRVRIISLQTGKRGEGLLSR